MAVIGYVSSTSGRSRSAHFGGSFELAGAGAPTDIDGDIVSVARVLADAGASEYFRVTFRDTAQYHSAQSALQGTAYLDNASRALFACVHVGSIVADGPTVAIDLTKQVDVAVKDAAGAFIDTTGIRINLGGVVKV